MPVEQNKLIIIENPFRPSMRRVVPIDYDPGRTLAQLVEMSGLRNPMVCRNGICVPPEELEAHLMPGDMVHIFDTPEDDNMRSVAMLAVAVIAYYYVGPAAAGYLEGAGMSAGAAQVWGTLAATAFVSAGGMLINGNMANPVAGIRGSVEKKSPTYGWSIGDNTAQEGIAIPVIYGHEATYPQIINQWLECKDMYGTDATHEQWWHALLCVANGRTNNMPTAEDIKLGGIPLTTLDADSYTLETTDGSATGAVLTNHESLHQIVPVGKDLQIVSVSQILLHFNGDDGSTDIIEDGVGTGGNYKIPGETGSVNNWTAHNSAALSTDHPFVGSAALELPGGGYISVDNWRAMALWTQETWDFECRFRQSTLTDCTIAYQRWIQTGYKKYCWGIHYDSSGQIVFQQYSADISGTTTYTVNIDLAVSASLSADTWHHIRVARSGNTVYIFLDGALLGSGSFSVAPEYAAGAEETSGTLNVGDTYYIETCDLGHFYYRSDAGETFTATEATTIDADNTVRNVSAGAHSQGLGMGYYYYSSITTDLLRSGNMELDEVRLRFKELIYDSLSSYTPPTNQIADANEQVYYTRGTIDGFWVNILCPYGVYFQDVDGLDPAAIETWISWRKVGTTTWAREYFGFLEFSRDPVMFQRYIAPSAGRGKYEIRVTRIIWEWALSYSASRFQVNCMLASIDEVLNESLSYPYLQLVGLSIKAQEKISGRPPAIRVESNRTLIEVPNYNGVGTRWVDPTNNAHASFDMFTNKIYGIGQDADRIVQDDWEDWEDWCDGNVAGNPRCRLNIVFDAPYDFSEALQHVESCGRAQVINRGSMITAVVDKPSSAVYPFCFENITPGTAKVSWLPQAQRSDAVEIAFRDSENDFVDASVLHKGAKYNTLTRMPRVARFTIPGINNRDQAMREAAVRQQISDSAKRSVSFQSGFESLKVTQGDVIDYASKGNLLAFTGRLARGSAREEQYTGTTVYLDKEITLDSATFSGNCILIVRNGADDLPKQYTISGPFDMPTWSVTVSASGTFDFLAPWIIGRPTEKMQYKISRIRRNSQKDAAIMALQYDESAYYHPDWDSGSTPI